jgi:hypothetical protein
VRQIAVRPRAEGRFIVINSTIWPTAALARPYPSLELRPVAAGWQSVATDAALARMHAANADGAATAATAMATFRHLHAAKQAKGNAPPRGTPR